MGFCALHSQDAQACTLWEHEAELFPRKLPCPCRGQAEPWEGSKAHTELRGQLSALCCSRGAETLPLLPFLCSSKKAQGPTCSLKLQVWLSPKLPSHLPGSRGAKCCNHWRYGIGENVGIGYLRNSQWGGFLIHIRPRTNALKLHTGLFWHSNQKQMLDGAASKKHQDSLWVLTAQPHKQLA